ncbi:MAG: DUF3048 domain-containing protein [Actinomycetota bacterium]
MTKRGKLAAAVGGVLVLAVGAFFLISNKEDIPLVNKVFPDPVTCPLTGVEPRDEALAERAAVAVKIENAPVAYPLSGLEDAEVVFEEVVEGGITRFMAIYHCTDSTKAGPVRSAREVDPAIMMPITKILAFSGANQTVLNALDEAGVVVVDETGSNGAMERVARAGLTSEHTLYADSKAVRKVARKGYSDPPPDDMWEFGSLEDNGKTKKAGEVTIGFSGATTVGYTWDGDGYLRTQGGQPFMAESGEQIKVPNVLIEEHEVNYSSVTDVAGNPSVEIADETGSGKAVLFRDGRAIVGTWSRESIDSPVVFETKSGDKMVFAEGAVWIHLVPSDAGEVKGSFSFVK